MSRLSEDAAKSAQTLQGKMLFGDIPVLKGMQSKPNRLTDQIDLIKDKAYQDGYRAGLDNGTLVGISEGRKAGFEAARKEARLERNNEAKQFFEDWESLRSEFEESLAAWYEQSEQAMTELTMEIVQRILATELQVNQQAALGICKEVLHHVTHAKQARVYINPSDYALFESHREELVKQSRELKSIEIVEDGSVRNGVMVETDAGMIDATIDTRLELISNELDQAA